MSGNLPVQAPPTAITSSGPVLPSGGRAPGGEEDVGNRGPVPQLTLADKAAVIIAALGPDAAPRVLQGMGEPTIRRFAQAMSGLWRISPEVLEQTIIDFTDELGSHQTIRGGVSEARRILRELLDDDSVSRIMDDVDVAGGRTLWEKLSNSSDQALAGFLRHEHPQTAAVVLSKMRSDKAARILERLDPEFAQVIVLRLARVPRLDSEVMVLMTQVIQKEFLSVMQREQATRRPADVIGSMMNNVSSAARARLLEMLEQEKPKLARQVQKVMFTFADIPDRVTAKDAGVVLKSVEEPTMMVALKMAEHNAPRIIDFFLGNISRRLAQRLENEIKQHTEVTPRDGEASQAEVVMVIREMAKNGEIKLNEVEEDD
jgi:flagellar motor switch protein FliG